MKRFLIELKKVFAKSELRALKSFVLSLCLVLAISLGGLSFVSLADVNDLVIGTGSNALMTIELDDEDYGISTFSSLARISNTVDYSSTYVVLQLIDEESGMYDWRYYRPNLSGEYSIYVPSGYVLDAIGYELRKGALPSSGVYWYQFDVTSVVSLDYNYMELIAYYRKDNVAQVTVGAGNKYYPQWESGDLYFEKTIKIGSPYTLENKIYLSSDLPSGSLVAGLVKYNFTVDTNFAVDLSPSGDYSSSLTEDYQNNVSSSLGDLSSSVDSMTDEIGEVTEAIQNLQGAMEPHYSNVLTQLHHITEQLHAFYDQVYNNIHLPELDMLTQIKTAIENIDLQIEVDISEVKTAINNMSQAVQNKLQTTTDQITGGYDNSGIVQENEKLEQSINNYDEVESEIFDEAGGFVGEFEYPSVESLSGGIIKALAFVGSFLQGVFLSIGDFGTIITFSLTMIFVMVIVGYHRIRS